MSVMGTGVGAGVAQAALQAQEVARNRDKERTETIQTANRVREIFETRLRNLEEGEEASKTHEKPVYQTVGLCCNFT